MHMRPQASVWLEIAEDDLSTAEHCFKGNRYLWAMFMCQQAAEKAIKAVYVEQTGETPPRKHDLVSLAGSAGILAECDENRRDLLRRLSLYYIETRYPDKRAQLEATCTEEYVGQMMARTKEVVEWLKNKLR